MPAKKPRECVVCGEPTMNRTQPHNTPRCPSSEFEACATRRDAGRARPRTEAGRALKEEMENA